MEHAESIPPPPPIVPSSDSFRSPLPAFLSLSNESLASGGDGDQAAEWSASTRGSSWGQRTDHLTGVMWVSFGGGGTAPCQRFGWAYQCWNSSVMFL